ncbi:hypothetical protein FUAX_37600 [Fulvitalea axinellae]|uniref:Uncharacterized protein n=1 Tax=Fulvitalea axinellae TaxID=1182444 RepID=A0AAU9CTC1_9BACT|nr:hypothetical protein FUAX_37600 [Fulvitalea axinellae]
MKNTKYLKILFWVLIFFTMASFWVSIRDERFAVSGGLVALGFCGVAFGLDRYIRKMSKDREEK